MKPLRTNLLLSLPLAGLLALSGLAYAEPTVPEGADGTPSALEEAHLRDLGSISRVTQTYARVGKAAVRRPSGVALWLKPEAGMNGPLLLQKAREQATRAKGAHPLALEGLEMRVAERGSHFVLYIDAPSVSTAREVMRRAQAVLGENS